MSKLLESCNGYSRVQFWTDEFEALEFPYLSMRVQNSVIRILDGKRLTLPHIDFNQVYLSDLAVILAKFQKESIFEFVRDALHTMILEEASYTKEIASLSHRRKWRKSIERCRKITPLRTASIPDPDDPLPGMATVRTILYLPVMESLPD